MLPLLLAKGANINNNKYTESAESFRKKYLDYYVLIKTIQYFDMIQNNPIVLKFFILSIPVEKLGVFFDRSINCQYQNAFNILISIIKKEFPFWFEKIKQETGNNPLLSAIYSAFEKQL